MSYLLDALRKAEHERRLGSVPDLETNTYQARSSAPRLAVWLPWLLGAIIAINGALIGFLVWRMGSGQAPRAAVGPHVASAVGSRSPAAGQSVSSPDTPVAGNNAVPDEGGAAEPDPAASAGKPAPRGMAPGNIHQPLPGAATATAPDRHRPSHDQGFAPPTKPDAVARSGTNALGGGAPGITHPDPPPMRALPAEVLEELPELNISGHLYSSVPGISFVLINGRRYHQGERLASGGAVESINPHGVVINYEGIRFSLAAPH